jgi:putative tryptophan/tyrosine transport system substrate-binding protein
MRRRDFIKGIVGSASAWPLAARATDDNIRRIGYLRAAPPPERELEPFLRGLADHGLVQGRDFVLIPQWGDGNVARLAELAVTLVNAGVDVIVTEGVTGARAARAVTATIPIVVTTGADPFVGGLVKNLARPGGNVTGFTTMSAETSGKVFEVFRDVVPGLKRAAVLAPRAAWELFASAQDQAAKALAIDLVYIDLPDPEAASTVMREAVSAGAQGALLRVGPFFSSTQRRKIIDLAAQLRLPVMYERPEDVAQGGLVSYSPDYSELFRRAAGYVARILSGTKAGELPMQQPTKFELYLNLKTAKALGLTIPDKLLALADKVIE